MRKERGEKFFYFLKKSVDNRKSCDIISPKHNLLKAMVSYASLIFQERKGEKTNGKEI